MQGLDTTVSEPAVKGTRDGTDGVLKESEALLEVIAVEGCDTHENIAVAVDVLGDTVYDDICAVLEGVLNVRTHESVVNNHEDAVLVGNFSYG
jgi:hypothetical protein